MLKKGRTLALGVVIAGAVGFGAPIASAATMAPLANGSTPAVNGITSQELQNCANAFYSEFLSAGSPSGLAGNALAGDVTGTQQDTTGWAIVKGLLANGVTGSTATAGSTTTAISSCGLTSQQLKSLYCAGDLPTSTVTTTQMPNNFIAALLGILGQSAVTTTTTTTTSSLTNLCSK
jgi:hypothetical protein